MDKLDVALLCLPDYSYTGPAGLQAARSLVEHNFTVRLFERAPGPGGNWAYSDQVPVRESYP